MVTFEEEVKAAIAPGPNRKTPGAVFIAADKTGNISYLKEEGVTSVSHSARDITADTTFWIASCTKLMTTVAAMQCVEKGLLDLDDDVTTILPEWKFPDILTGFGESGEPTFRKATKTITLRQLLTHSAGMGYDFLSPKLIEWVKWRKIDVKALDGDIQKRHKMPLVYEPGYGWEYSCGIDWAGLMVERVNNNTRLSDYCREHIWSPLGMRSTTFRPLEDKNISKNLVTLTNKDATGELTTVPAMRNMSPKDDLGGGGIYSSPNDYIKLLATLLKNNGTLLKPETVDLMFSPQLQDDRYLNENTQGPTGTLFQSGANTHGHNWGLGGLLNMMDVEGLCYEGTMTWGGLPNLFWWIDRKAGNCGLYASQLVPPGDPDSMALAIAFRREMFKRATKI